MYPNPLIPIHAGVYIKEDPLSKSNFEVFELRPDMLIAWAVVPLINDSYFDDLQFHGRWSVSRDRLYLVLIDEDESGIAELYFHLVAEEWVLESNPSIVLRKRSGMESIEGPFYYDYR